MRLLATHSLEMVEFIGTSIPDYAILSHTWDGGEVAFQDMVERRPGLIATSGYRKIAQACKQALGNSYSYLWVDTCCIDKRSSAELTEAINSMYQWYHDADKCYVYLSDLPSQTAGVDALLKSRWFTRGWTLQELLAPAHVAFYDSAWRFRGNKTDFAAAISASTGINATVLVDSQCIPLFSIATKMSWAAHRETTRIEDTAYSLLGIFDVNMALLYGEGRKAFRRLQEEIVKKTNELTIFAWQRTDSNPRTMESILAPSASLFSSDINIIAYRNAAIDFSITNKGIRILGETRLRVVSTRSQQDGAVSQTYVLLLGSVGGHSNESGGICLRKIGPRLFCRDGRYPLVGFGRNAFTTRRRFLIDDYYILSEPTSLSNQLLTSYRQGTLSLPQDADWTLSSTCPESLWDETDRMFLNVDEFGSGTDSALLFAQFVRHVPAGKEVSVIAVCEYKSQRPDVRLFLADHTTEPIVNLIFEGKFQYNGLSFDDLQMRSIRLPRRRPSISFRAGGQKIQLTASVVPCSRGRTGQVIVEGFRLSLDTGISN